MPVVRRLISPFSNLVRSDENKVGIAPKRVEINLILHCLKISKEKMQLGEVILLCTERTICDVLNYLVVLDGR